MSLELPLEKKGKRKNLPSSSFPMSYLIKNCDYSARQNVIFPGVSYCPGEALVDFFTIAVRAFYVMWSTCAPIGTI